MALAIAASADDPVPLALLLLLLGSSSMPNAVLFAILPVHREPHRIGH
jgi:hypothetical protein